MENKQKSIEGSSGPWYGAEPEIPESAPMETVNTEILIIGGGTGGMTAAIFAGRMGAKTLVIEKNATVGYYKTYNGVIDSRAQREAGVKGKIDKEDLVQELLHYPAQYDDVDRRLIENANPVDEKLIRLWVEESGVAIDILADELSEYGIRHVAETDVGDGHHGKFKIFPTHTKFIVPLLKGGPKGHVHGGVGVIEPWLVKKAKSFGVEFRFNTPLVKFVKRNNKVIGAIARKKNGDYIRIEASRGVLLCTGGYSDDHELFAKLNPQAAAVTSLYYGQKGNTGDGLKAAIWAGGEKARYGTAGLFDRGMVKPGGKAGPPFRRLGPTLGPLDAFHMGSQPFLKVNMDGKRFLNEAVPYDVIIYPLQYEKNHVCNVIWDSKYWKNIESFRLVGCCRQIPSPTKPRTYEGIGKTINRVLLARGAMTGYIQKADTIEGLARKLRLPVAQFKATVDRYNKMAKAGVDEDFGKPAKDLIALDNPPFYGVTNAGWMMHTTDGLRINEDMQVLDKEGGVIGGLYATGDVAGGFFGTNYYPELIVGVASGKTITFARHAVLHMMRGTDTVPAGSWGF
ncbi:MAG: FAD-dependent oxidoreductase [Telmatospirillum sp.]|nr:FAD-dependent oxidoreductase [Telmatospirillum sp.]